MNSLKTIICLITLSLLVGCATTKPNFNPLVVNEVRTIDMPIDQLWKQVAKAVPEYIFTTSDTQISSDVSCQSQNCDTGARLILINNYFPKDTSSIICNSSQLSRDRPGQVAIVARAVNGKTVVTVKTNFTTELYRRFEPKVIGTVSGMAGKHAMSGTIYSNDEGKTIYYMSFCYSDGKIERDILSRINPSPQAPGALTLMDTSDFVDYLPPGFSAMFNSDGKRMTAETLPKNPQYLEKLIADSDYTFHYHSPVHAFELGVMYAKGINTAPNINRAFEWFKKARDYDNSDVVKPIAAYNIGYLYEINHKESQALEWYQKSVAAINPSGVFKSAYNLATGKLGAIKNEEKAIDLFLDVLQLSRPDEDKTPHNPRAAALRNICYLMNNGTQVTSYNSSKSTRKEALIYSACSSAAYEGDVEAQGVAEQAKAKLTADELIVENKALIKKRNSVLGVNGGIWSSL